MSHMNTACSPLHIYVFHAVIFDNSRTYFIIMKLINLIFMNFFIQF